MVRKILLCLLWCAAFAQADLPVVDYQRDIEPLLTRHCYKCHGSESAKSGLRVDSRESVLTGGDGGPAAIVGNSADSELVKRITSTDPDYQMPPKGERLAAEQVALIRAWIDQGVKWSEPLAAPSVTTRPATPTDPVYDLLMMDGKAQLIYRRGKRLKKLPTPPAPPQVPAPADNDIDRFIAARWPAESPSPELCGDSTFLRRAYLDVIGRIPTIDEVAAFTKEPSREKLIDALLARNEEYADHWTPFWEEALASNPSEIVGGIPSHGDYKAWINQSFKENKPFDVFAAELLDPRMPGHRPSKITDIYGKNTQSGYILNQTHSDTIQTASNVGQVFLGTGMKCASCHNHFENTEWPQTRFLGFAGLFAPQHLEQIRCEQKIGGAVTAAFPFDVPGAPLDAPHDLDGRLHYAALLLTDPLNPRFAKSIVNRLWKRYLGLGLFEPVDDFRLDSPPSHPELLEWLAHDFMTRGYNLKHTIRLILNSRTYQLRYDPKLEDHFDLAKRDEPRYYRSPSLRKLTAEQLFDSIRLTARQKLESSERLYHKNDSTALTRAMSRPPTRNEVSTQRSEEVAVVQSLELLNGGEYHKLIYAGNGLSSAALASSSYEAAIDRLFLATLNRRPTALERDACAKFLAGNHVEFTSGNPETQPADDHPSRGAIGDVLWVLLSGPEFQYIH